MCKLKIIFSIFMTFECIRSQFRPHRATQCITEKDCGVNITCDNGVCECQEASHDLIYDKYRKTCSKRIGSFCIPFVDDCVSNSYCDIKIQQCRCKDPNYSATSFGECRLNYGESCGKGKPSCNPEKFFRCNAEWDKCTCANDEEQIYDPRLQSCFARPFERCELFEYGISPPCAQNSFCIQIDANNPTDDFGECRCIDGFQSTGLSPCLPGHGFPCELRVGCVPGKYYQCLPTQKNLGICSCENGRAIDKNTGYCKPVIIESTPPPSCDCNDESLKDFHRKLCDCKVKAGEGCNDFDICVSHAVCEDGECQCTKNYKRTLQGHCKLPYKFPCLDSTECDEDSLLQCINYTCQCQESEFNQATQNCDKKRNLPSSNENMKLKTVAIPIIIGLICPILQTLR